MMTGSLDFGSFINNFSPLRCLLAHYLQKHADPLCKRYKIRLFHPFFNLNLLFQVLFHSLLCAESESIRSVLGSFFNIPSRYFSLSLIFFTQLWFLPSSPPWGGRTAFIYHLIEFTQSFDSLFHFALHYFESFFYQLLRYINSLTILFILSYLVTYSS